MRHRAVAVVQVFGVNPSPSSRLMSPADEGSCEDLVVQGSGEGTQVFVEGLVETLVESLGSMKRRECDEVLDR
jgi:hypothetical protein